MEATRLITEGGLLMKILLDCYEDNNDGGSVGEMATDWIKRSGAWLDKEANSQAVETGSGGQ